MGNNLKGDISKKVEALRTLREKYKLQGGKPQCRNCSQNRSLLILGWERRGNHLSGLILGVLLFLKSPRFGVSPHSYYKPSCVIGGTVIL